MLTNSPIIKALLDGQCPRLGYGDLEVALKGTQEFTMLDPEGPYRYWSHDLVTGILKLRDNGTAPMFSQYVAKAGKYIQDVRSNGGLR